MTAKPTETDANAGEDSQKLILEYKWPDLKRRVRELQGSEGVLILTDMFGGTATNLALPFLEPGKVEVVTGANLPMLVKLAALRDTDLDLHELAQRLASTGQKSIRLASEFLRRHTRE